MKPVFKLSLIFLICLSACGAFAQRGYTPDVARAIGNSDMQWQSQMSGLRMLGMRGGDITYNFKYTFTVTMADGTTKEVNSKIYVDTSLHKNYLLFVDKSLPKTDSNRNQKIFPEQTKEISRNVALISGNIKKADFATPPRYYRGIAKDSCWMFKVISGSINAYSFLSEEDGQMFNPSTIVAIQLNDGAIVKFNEENLKQMVGDDIDALEIIQRKNYMRAIKKFNRNREKEKK
ncbi:hypothetical protein [Mucilaginibacter celer]|uniref:DUF4412 domain-containing protein n=1 Tax=Mucilaginibacter celer TaxID=2305508 RepID=A0A494VLT3_9SPHI|nr:hypothetical protein [Mucilaginibacter celer]AYL95049.1 hypothetical protein HYN43_006945 [Mucilaginibacter celer]